MGINKLGIDCDTIGKGELIRRLSKLKTTISVEDNGEYHQDRSYSQVFIDTTWTETELDDWLYKTKIRCDYVGTFERKGDFLSGTEQVLLDNVTR